MKKIKLLSVLGLLLVMLTACSSSSSIVGRWEEVEGGFFSELEFFSDGKYDSDRSNYSGSYSVEEDRIMLQGILMPTIKYNFKVSGDTLKFYEEGEERGTYKRTKD